MPTPTYDLIASYTVTSATSANITFTNLPSTYRHLVVHGASKGSLSLYWENLYGWVNSDTDSTRQINARYNDLGTPGGDFDFLVTSGGRPLGYHAAINATSTFHSNFTFAPRYSDANTYKIIFNDGAQQYYTQSTEGELYSRSAWWYQTASSAITSITYDAQGDFQAGSTYYLYGLKSS